MLTASVIIDVCGVAKSPTVPWSFIIIIEQRREAQISEKMFRTQKTHTQCARD